MIRPGMVVEILTIEPVGPYSNSLAGHYGQVLLPSKLGNDLWVIKFDQLFGVGPGSLVFSDNEFRVV